MAGWRPQRQRHWRQRQRPQRAGRQAVLGSAAMFDDDWLGKEDNTPLLDFLLGWMLKDPACSLSARSMAEPEIVDARPVTHVAELAAQPRVCLQASAAGATAAAPALGVHGAAP